MLVQYGDNGICLYTRDETDGRATRPSRTGRAPAAGELAEQFIADFPPWPPGFRVAAILGQPFAQQLPVPIRHTDFFRLSAKYSTGQTHFGPFGLGITLLLWRFRV